MTQYYETEWHSHRHTRYVYFLAPIGGGLIKIGCAKEPRSRLGQMLSWSPIPLEILAVARGTFYDERKLHALFIERHSHSEWFHPCPALLELIDRIKLTGELPPECRGARGEPSVLRAQNGRSRELRSAAMKLTWAKKRASGEPWATGWKYRIQESAQ